MKTLFNALAIIGLTFAAPALAPAAGGQCGLCGGEITPSNNVFTLTRADGTTQTYGCPGCGLHILHTLGNDPAIKAEAQDFLSRTTLDARSAWYLHGSSVGHSCALSWQAFATQEDAEKFSKGFGGKVLDFRAALAVAGQEDHSGMMGGDKGHELHHH